MKVEKPVGDVSCGQNARRHDRRCRYHQAAEAHAVSRSHGAAADRPLDGCGEAQRWGIVSEILEPEELLHRAWNLARALTEGPPLVFAAIKEVARDAESMRFQEALNRVTKRQFPTVDRLYDSDDLQEGSRALAEKRSPVWKCR